MTVTDCTGRKKKMNKVCFGCSLSCLHVCVCFRSLSRFFFWLLFFWKDEEQQEREEVIRRMRRAQQAREEELGKEEERK